MVIAIVVVVVLLLAVAPVLRIVRRNRRMGDLSPDERAERIDESRRLRDEHAAARAEQQARDAAGSGSAQAQTRQF